MLWLENAYTPKINSGLAALLAGAAILAACADRTDRAEHAVPEAPTPCDFADGLLADGLLDGDGQFGDAARFVHMSSADEALRMFTQAMTQADEVGFGGHQIPRLLARTMPADLESLDSVTRRKQAFVAVVLPLALKANEEICANRRFVERALACRQSGRPLGTAARERLRRLFDAYDANRDTQKLLDRLDTVPPSLILAQAAIESGWGTSRFAMEGNALFGQRTTRPDRGLKANGVAEGEDAVHVASFPHLLASVRAYVHNLNTNASYRAFRAKRAARRAAGRWPNGIGIAETLVRYSARGPAYISELNAIIRGNDFVAFDDAHLEPTVGILNVAGS